jgi:hypothetical protein
MTKSQNTLVWTLFGYTEWFWASIFAQLAEAGERQQSCAPATEEY